jgi:hypothetical protein
MIRPRPFWLGSRLRSTTTIVIAAIGALLLSSCAVFVNGTTQIVPVSSQPTRAEVFLDGVSVGFTPIDLRLQRNREHVVTVRLGDRQRVITLTSSVQAGMIALDVVPIGAAGGLALVGCAISSELGGGSCAGGVVLLAGLASIPLLVDGATGALYRLGPDAIVIDFDAP